jgi:hypothetical protein
MVAKKSVPIARKIAKELRDQKIIIISHRIFISNS